MEAKKIIRYISAIILIASGLLVFSLSTSIIFEIFTITAKVGNYALFVVWSFLISSIIYLFLAYGFIKGKSWTASLLGFTSVILIIAYISLKVHISNNEIYAMRTASTIIFGICLTITLTFIAYFTIPKGEVNELEE